MNSNIRQVLKLIISLVLLGLLSGCSPLEVVIFGPTPQQVDPEPWNTGKNHYEPVVLASNKDMIQIKYLSVGPNAEHEQVTQLISDHCHDAYTETNRVEMRGYTTVDAECNHGTESLQ